MKSALVLPPVRMFLRREGGEEEGRGGEEEERGGREGGRVRGMWDHQTTDNLIGHFNAVITFASCGIFSTLKHVVSASAVLI